MLDKIIEKILTDREAMEIARDFIRKCQAASQEQYAAPEKDGE